TEPKVPAVPAKPPMTEPKPKTPVAPVKPPMPETRPSVPATVKKEPRPGSSPAAPAVVLQVKPVHDLQVSLNTTAKNFLPDALLKEVESNFLGTLDMIQMAGVDAKKPLGLYATVGDGAGKGDLSKSSVVVVVPVSDTKTFLDSLARFGVRTEKRGD